MNNYTITIIAEFREKEGNKSTIIQNKRPTTENYDWKKFAGLVITHLMPLLNVLQIPQPFNFHKKFIQ